MKKEPSMNIQRIIMTKNKDFIIDGVIKRWRLSKVRKELNKLSLSAIVMIIGIQTVVEIIAHLIMNNLTGL